MSVASRARVLHSDPDLDREGGVQFRLTYQGELLAAGNGNKHVRHKHQIRRSFHKQLRRFWTDHPYLNNALMANALGMISPAKLMRDHLAEQFDRMGYNFIPLVTEQLELICSVDILYLRDIAPGKILTSGDIDNRLKTLFDALRMPKHKEELGGYDNPSEDERPFYVLLEDDSLISRVSVETDGLLEPTAEPAKQNDARIIITVNLRPYRMGWHNLSFA